MRVCVLICSLALSCFVSLCIALIFWGNLRESLLFGATTWEMRIFIHESEPKTKASEERKKLRTV